MEIIDPHVHVWIDDPKYPFAKEVKEKPKENAHPDRLLQLMKANGVSKTVLVQVIHYRWDNSFCADVRAQHPTTFMAVGRVNPTDHHAPEHLEHWTKERGLHGVRLSPSRGPEAEWINDRTLMDPLWKKASDLKVPM